MKPLTRILIVAGIQFLILFSIIGFKQYTVWTGESVLLRTAPVDPRDLLRGDFIRVRYEISTLDPRALAGDPYPYDEVYVELREGSDQYWQAVAIHEERERSFDDTVLIKGEVVSTSPSALDIEYGIEQVFIPAGSGDQLPSGPDHIVAVEVKVDRFGNAVPRRFFVDGEPFELERE